MIALGERKTVYKCPQDETVIFLKAQIEDDEGLDPSTQFLYKKGYLIDSDGYRLSDFLENKDELVLCLETAAPTEFKNKTSEHVWIINGNKHYFHPHFLEPETKHQIKLKSDHFGLVYHIEGFTPGTREFQVKRFT